MAAKKTTMQPLGLGLREMPLILRKKYPQHNSCWDLGAPMKLLPPRSFLEVPIFLPSSLSFKMGRMRRNHSRLRLVPLCLSSWRAPTCFTLGTCLHLPPYLWLRSPTPQTPSSLHGFHRGSVKPNGITKIIPKGLQ